MLNDNGVVKLGLTRPIPDALALEYKRDYGTARGDLNIADLMNNPALLRNPSPQENLALKIAILRSGVRTQARLACLAHLFQPSNEAGGAEDMTKGEVGQYERSGSPGVGGKVHDGMFSVFSLNVPFAKGTISVQVHVTGDTISPAHLARVRKYLELAESQWDGGDG